MQGLLSNMSRVDWREKLKPVAGIWLGAGLFAAIAVLLLVIFNPAFAVREVAEQAKQHGNLELGYDSARFQLFPQPALRLEGARLVTAGGKGYRLVTAETAVFPMPLRALLKRRLTADTVTLERPVINLLVDAQGQSGLAGSNDALDAALARSAEPQGVVAVRISDGTFKFLDERNGQSFQLQQATLDLSLGRNGAADLRGTVAIAEQFARVEAHVASLPRFLGDGSPADGMIEAPNLEASFAGLAGLRNGLSLAGTFAAGSDSASKLASWMGMQALARLPLQELRMSGPLVSTAAVFTSRDLDLRLGSSEFKGELSLDAGSARPRISGKVSASRITLANPLEAAAGTLGWPTGALELGWINDIDLDLNIDAYKLNWNRGSLGPVSLRLACSDGALEVQLGRTAAFGGNVEAALALDASKPVVSARLKLLADGIEFAGVARELAGSGGIEGRGGFTISTTSEGNTIEQMVSTLNGDASISLLSGSIGGIDVPASIGAAARGEQSGWVKTAGATGIAEAQGSFRLKDGIASSEDLAGKVADVKVRATGEIDLLRRAFNLDVRPDAKADAPSIHVGGPWQAPKLSMRGNDAAGTGSSPAAASKVAD